ncbi:putative PhzA/B-like protein [Actinoplanes sp. NBRC 14428]|uniref:SnoaL-like domain-containing protein n=1 Tax=Pseudosporangium ferrugineum TaxID=439699 RepID=A0A2T0RXH6_9ACTN|nr:nuclear transport factor 2 family protein [Pseudosporangium ferrugineum]PRY25850.1 hypothetical protein CLV70_112216 [Pseudosporangium ferrugineum]BCJ56095.1 putative PhzA/B-like protein [Actinoplanes sp. NBRC 14428]
MDNHKTVRSGAQQAFLRHVELLGAGRGAEWAELFTEDGVLEFPYAPQGYPRRVAGRRDLLAHQEGFARTFRVEFTGVRFHETVDPALVIAELECDGVALATGRPYRQKYISLVETRDGLISRYVDYWNPQVVAEALAA